MDRDTEIALVARLRAGDPDAFDVVHDAYHARLYNFLARLSRRRDVAEDLLEETWLRLIATAGRLQADTRLGPWLYTVARNLFYSYCRSRYLDESHAASLIGLWPTVVARPSPFEEVAARELERLVERALARMPAQHREVLLLVGVEGLTPAEAAAICGVTPETLRQRLFRARVSLDRALDRRTPEPDLLTGEVTP
jgi:RNA polymerase sigma-70 factor (ECF subfamily)